jgi:hypothetical protein
LMTAQFLPERRGVEKWSEVKWSEVKWSEVKGGMVVHSSSHVSSSSTLSALLTDSLDFLGHFCCCFLPFLLISVLTFFSSHLK